MIDQIKYRYPKAPILLLDSGNFSDNPTPTGRVKTKALLEAMENLGYQAVNVGERDVRLGYEEFRAVSEGRKLEFVSANIVNQETDEPIFAPHAIIRAKSADGKEQKKIGVVGAVRYNPIFLKAGPGESSMVIAPPAKRVAREVEALKKKNVDAIVLLAALHKADALKIAEEVPGIDYVFASYGGMYTAEPESVGDVRVFYSGNRGQRLIENRIFLDKKNEPLTRVHFLNREYPFDQEMLDFVNRYETDHGEAEAGLPAAQRSAP